jgi:hypothetical protein
VGDVPSPDAGRELATLLADALSGLEQVSASLSVGSVTRPAVPPDVARFVEGRWAALREVDRRAALDGIAAALATVRRDWSAGPSAGAVGGDRAGDAAYRAGGLAALDELATHLHPSAHHAAGS